MLVLITSTKVLEERTQRLGFGSINPVDIQRKGRDNYFNYCHNNIVNLDIVPYHSEKFPSGNLSQVIKGYLWNRLWEDIFPLLQRNVNKI